MTTRRPRRKILAGPADLQPGQKKIVELDGKMVGLFNVAGTYHALHNRCPHMAGALCEGPVSGTALPTDSYSFEYGREGELIRCGWHGWEFEIATGRCLVDDRLRAKRYIVTEEQGELYLHL
jgi:nitrite reductase/ring-hydroxylating ferredoxin subunit